MKDQKSPIFDFQENQLYLSEINFLFKVMNQQRQFLITFMFEIL